MGKLHIVILAILSSFAMKVCALEGEAGELVITGSVIKSTSTIRNIEKTSLSRQDILTISPVSVIELLRSVPGVNVTQQGGQGGLTFVSLRGGEPNFTVVMINGVKVNDSINSRGGGYDFVGLDPLLIQSIDVYFGGLSPVYGSEALGGVISIKTLNQQESTQTVTIEGGSDDQKAASFHFAELLGESSVLNVSGGYRDGGNAIEGDSLERNQISLNLYSLLSSETEWQFNFFNSNGDSSSFPEDSGGDQLAVIREAEQRQFQQNNLAGSISLPINDFWRMSLAATRSEHDEELTNPGIAAGFIPAVPPILSDSHFSYTSLNVTNTLKLTEKTEVGFGGEWVREKGKFDSVIDFGFPVVANFDIDRDIQAFFAEVNHQVSEGFSVMAGMRSDDADGIDETTYRFASRYHLKKTETDFVFQYGEGFKLPSFFALGHPLVGNSALEAEFSRNFAFGVEQMLADDRLKLTATYFYNRFTNLVDFDPVLFTNVNRSRVDVKGGELQLTYLKNDRFQTSTYVTYSDYDTDPGVILRRRPEWTGGFSLLFKPNDLVFLNLAADYVGHVFDSSLPTGTVKLQGFTKLDVTWGYRLGERSELKVLCNNVLNSDFEETVGFSNPGREFRIQFELSL